MPLPRRCIHVSRANARIALHRSAPTTTSAERILIQCCQTSRFVRATGRTTHPTMPWRITKQILPRYLWHRTTTLSKYLADVWRYACRGRPPGSLHRLPCEAAGGGRYKMPPGAADFMYECGRWPVATVVSRTGTCSRMGAGRFSRMGAAGSPARDPFVTYGCGRETCFYVWLRVGPKIVQSLLKRCGWEQTLPPAATRFSRTGVFSPLHIWAPAVLHVCVPPDAPPATCSHVWFGQEQRLFPAATFVHVWLRVETHVFTHGFGDPISRRPVFTYGSPPAPAIAWLSKRSPARGQFQSLPSRAQGGGGLQKGGDAASATVAQDARAALLEQQPRRTTHIASQQHYAD